MISPFISPFCRGSRWFPSDRTQATDLCPREHELGSYGLPRLWAFWDDRACGTSEAGWGRLEMFPQMVDILNIYLYIYIYLFIIYIYIYTYIYMWTRFHLSTQYQHISYTEIGDASSDMCWYCVDIWKLKKKRQIVRSGAVAQVFKYDVDC